MSQPPNNRLDDILVPLSSLKLLSQATTHSSFANEHGLESNERLELLGDAVISLACVDYLYSLYPGKTEGELTQIKTMMTNGRQLAEIGKRLDLGSAIKLGKGEALNERTLGRAMEAVVGALFLTKGYDVTKDLLVQIFDQMTTEKIPFVAVNYKGDFQALVRSSHQVDPTYRVLESVGPPHDRTFTVEAWIKNRAISSGSGKSIKDAEQDAARAALTKMCGSD